VQPILVSLQRIPPLNLRSPYGGFYDHSYYAPFFSGPHSDAKPWHPSTAHWFPSNLKVKK